MAAVDRTVKLPDGSMVKVRVPEEWGRDEIEVGLKERGMWREAPAPEPEDLPAFDEGTKPETEPKRDWSDQLDRQLGLTVRHAVQGATAFPLMVGDAANALLNFIPGVNLGSPLQIADAALTEAGLPEPETAAERVVGAAAQAVAGAGAGIRTAAQTAPQLIRGALTEGAGAQGVAAAAGGAGFQGAAEADLGPVGQVVAGLGAAFAGAGATAASARRLGMWADARAKTGQPVTTEEVTAVTKAHGINADPEELKQFQDAVNKIKEAGEVRQATLEALLPKKDVPVEVGRAQARIAREEFKDTIRGAFESDAERDDFVKRVIQKKAEDVDLDGKAPVEVQRARKRLGVQAANDARIMDEIRARQEALLAKLEAERTTPPTQVIRDAVVKPQRDVIRRNEEVFRTASDDVSAAATFGQKTVKRMEQIAPRIATAVRRATVMANRRTGAQYDRIKGWAGDKDIARKLKKDPEYKAAVLNRDVDTMERLLPGSAAKYKAVEDVLDEYQALLKAEGRPILDDGIHPRAVTDLKKLRRFRNTPEWSNYQKARNERMRKLGRNYLTEHEEAGLISQLVGGHPVKQFRGRTIKAVTPEEAKYYLDPQASMMDYIHSIEENIAAKAFFKNTLGADIKLGAGVTQDQLRDHIGGVIATGVRRGDLKGQDVDQLVELLDTHFGVARQGPGEFQRKAKDFFTALTLGFNPLSTATQIADIGISASRFGPAATIRGLFGKDVADLYASGLRNAATDFRTPHTLPERFVRRSLKTFGFSAVDKIGNRTAMNAAYRKRAALANKAPETLRKQLEPLFGPRDTTKIMDDLVNNRYTDDVATLIAHDVADIRPISREDMPLGWNQNPKGRIKYSLLSWSINQLNFVRNAAFKNIEEGLRRQGTPGERAKGAKQVAKGVKDLVVLTTMFGLANVPAGITKDLLQGRELEPETHFVAGMVPFGMTGKFAVEALMGYDPGSTIAKVVPAYGITLDAVGRTLQGITEGDVDKLITATPTGRSLYRIITGDGLDNVLGAGGAVLDAVIPAAGAATHQYLDPAQPVVPDRPLPQVPRRDVQAERETGIEGARRLPEPEALRDNVAPEDELRLRAAIEQEQLRQEPAPEPQQVAADPEFIKKHETSRTKRGGWDSKDGVWKPYGSIEGGTPTIAHGHKLKPEEVTAGTINIGGEEVDYKAGLTDEQADALLQQDMAVASSAIDRLVVPELTPEQRTALTSLVFNVGVNSFAKSKALKALNSGDLDEFRKQAFSAKEGWTKVKGKLNAGLVKRRRDEERLFFG